MKNQESIIASYEVLRKYGESFSSRGIKTFPIFVSIHGKFCPSGMREVHFYTWKEERNVEVMIDEKIVSLLATDSKFIDECGIGFTSGKNSGLYLISAERLELAGEKIERQIKAISSRINLMFSGPFDKLRTIRSAQEIFGQFNHDEKFLFQIVS